MKTINVRVSYFGMARDMAGLSEEALSLLDNARVEDLMNEAVRKHPGLARMKRQTRVAVDEVLAQGNDRLADGDRAALLPPVAGG